MKKKIINGIMMVALLVAASTSFVSCKDNVDDVATELGMDIAKAKQDLQSQISTLEGQISTLSSSVAANTTAIQGLQAELNQLKNDLAALEGKVNTNTQEIEALKTRVTALENAVAALQQAINSLITQVTAEETADAVLGTVNLPANNFKILASYYGENLTGITRFPVAGDEYNVDPDGDVLYDNEFTTVVADSSQVYLGGFHSLISHHQGNVGKLYFSVNPTNADITNVSFDLINSRGEVSPMVLDEVKPSDHLLCWTMGKHGNGDGTRADDVYLYEAEVTLPMEAINSVRFDYSFMWKANDAINDLSALATAVADDHGSLRNAVKDGLQIIQNFYNGVYSQRRQLAYYGLRAQWSNGTETRNVVSDFDITTSAIKALNYKQMWLLDPSMISGAAKNAGDALAGAAASVYAKISNTSEDPEQIKARAKDYLEKASNKIIAEMTKNGKPAGYNMVTPILLFVGSEGVDRLVPEMNLIGDSRTTFIMTSPTEEYIVPACLKYIAVLQGHRIYECHLHRGTDKITRLDLPMGDSEVIYQVMDYSGNVVTKRYPIHRSEN